MNDYGYNLDRLMTVYRLLLLSVSLPYFINDTLSDLKGDVDVVINIVVHTSCFRILLINILTFSYEYCHRLIGIIRIIYP